MPFAACAKPPRICRPNIRRKKISKSSAKRSASCGGRSPSSLRTGPSAKSPSSARHARRGSAPAYQAAEQFGKAMAENGWWSSPVPRAASWKPAIAAPAADNSMGINIMLPFEQSANPIIAGDAKLVHMKYFFTRKLMFVKECDAVVCLPGGFGTLDEAFEVLTLLQTGKRDLMPLVFLDAPGGSYWKDWLSYVHRHLLDEKMIAAEDLSLFRVTESVDEAVDEIQRFYRVFDDMEYVNNRLVLRLQKPVSQAKLQSMQRDFADILTTGDFQQEAEPTMNGATTKSSPRSRLLFHFNRRSLGRLRQLIDSINLSAA